MRTSVVGSSGSGKSTVARRLADILGVPYVELDAIHWRPGWVEEEPAAVARDGAGHSAYVAESRTPACDSSGFDRGGMSNGS